MSKKYIIPKSEKVEMKHSESLLLPDSFYMVVGGAKQSRDDENVWDEEE